MPGVADRLGVGYQAVSAANPGIVYVSVSGFGQTGPYAQRPGYNTIAQGMSGLMGMTGMPGDPPTRAGGSMADVAAAYLAFGAISAALVHRLRTGQGQHLDVSLLAATLGLLPDPVAHLFDSGVRPARVGNRNPTLTPAEAFRTSDGWLNIVLMNPDQWDRFCRVLGDEVLRTEPRFATNLGRLANHDRDEGPRRGGPRDRDDRRVGHALRGGLDRGGPIYELDEVFDDPQIQHLGLVAEVEQPRYEAHGGRARMLGFPFRASATPPSSAAPRRFSASTRPRCWPSSSGSPRPRSPGWPRPARSRSPPSLSRRAVSSSGGEDTFFIGSRRHQDRAKAFDEVTALGVEIAGGVGSQGAGASTRLGRYHDRRAASVTRAPRPLRSASDRAAHLRRVRGPPRALPENGLHAAQLRRRALQPVLAQVDHVDVVGQPEGAANVLVDEDDTHALVAQRRQRRIDALGDDGRHSCRRLVDEEVARIAHQHPGQLDHPPLSPGQLAGSAAPAALEHGEARVVLVELPADPPAVAPERPGADHDVLLDGHLGEDPRLLRPVRHSPLDHPVGGVPVMSTPSRSTCPLAGLRKPKIAFRSVDFPTPFAPRMAVTRPGRATTLTPRRMWRSR